jgi:hypothetical protein
VLPPEVQPTILADRGFGDQKWYELLTDLEFALITRFRGVVVVESGDDERHPASDWVQANGQIRHLNGARFTADRYPVDSVVCVKAHGMKDAWRLAVGGTAVTGAVAVKLYGRRFTIEENFRDTKDPRYGLGLSATHVRDVRRRDRLLLICAMAMTLLTLLGAAGESLGMDRMLKANTSKKRTHLLSRQGCTYRAPIPAMKQEELKSLVQRFGEYVPREPTYVHAFGLK